MTSDAPSQRPATRAPGPRRGLALAGKSLCALLSLVVLIGSGVAWATYRDFTLSVATAGNLPAAGSDGTADIDGVDQNILLIGNDSRAGATPAELQALATQDDGGATNTDTMIVLHVPADGSRATLISFPRDSYVDIPGYPSDRINAAYGDAYQAAIDRGASENAAEGAGIVLTAETISRLTGLTIDHYLQINLLGFYRISNAVGGVDVCLNEAQQESDSGIDLHKGVNTIQGTQALAFVRQRHGLPNSDLDRVVRQRYFLGAVFRKISTARVLLNPFTLQNLLKAVSSSLLTDPRLNLLTLATQLQDLTSGNIVGATMVTTGSETIDGKDVLGVDPDQVKAQMRQLIGMAATPTPTPSAAGPTVAPHDVTVQVLNGSGVGMAATTASQVLRTAGMDVLDPGDTTPTEVTTVRYPPGSEAQANTVAATVPGATLTPDPSVSTVTLVLGADGLTPGGGAATSTSTAPSVPASATGAPAVDNATGGLACIN